MVYELCEARPFRRANELRVFSFSLSLSCSDSSKLFSEFAEPGSLAFGEVKEKQQTTEFGFFFFIEGKMVWG